MEELNEGEAGELGGTLAVGASTGPGSTVVPVLLCEFQRENPGVAVSLSISDTQSVVERVAERELELGVVGAARRHRGVVFEPLFRDEVVLAVPPGHRFAGQTVTLDQLREEPLIVMQEGAGVRQVIEDELRSAGTRLKRAGAAARARPAGIRQGGGRRRLRRHLHLARGDRGRPRRRHAGNGAREGARSRARDLARPLGRTLADARRRGVPGLRARAPVIVRWGLDELDGLLAELADRAPVRRCQRPLERSSAPAAGPLERGADRSDCRGRRGCGGSRRPGRGRRRQRDRPGQGRLRRDRSAARLGADDLLGRRVDRVLRRPRSRPPDEGRRCWRATCRDRLRAAAHARPAARPNRRDGAERARALRRGALRRGPQSRGRPRGADRCEADRRGVAACACRRPRSREPAPGCSRAPSTPAPRSARRAWPLVTRWPRRLAAVTGSPMARRTRSACSPALRFNEPVAAEAIGRFGEALGVADPAARVEELARASGFTRLRELGVPEDELDEVAAAVVAARRREGEPACGEPGPGRRALALDLVSRRRHRVAGAQRVRIRLPPCC